MEMHKSDTLPSICGQRWILAYIFSAGFFFLFALRVNMSVALVCMVKSTYAVDYANSSNTFMANKTHEYMCGVTEVSSVNVYEGGEFEWDKHIQSYILASFFYGYIVTQIPGGWMADRFGGWRVFGTAMAIAGVSTLLVPVCARISVILVYVLRVILGLASVRSVFGIVGTFATSGVLCEHGFDNGWGSIFYILGILCCAWVVVWFVQVRDSPVDHPRIKQIEKDYIINNIEFDTAKRTNKVPWKDMATSGPFWAILVCHICDNWAVYTLMTSLPAFMKGVLKYDIQSNGALSSLPYICSAVVTVIVGHAADALRRKHILTTTKVRKAFQIIGNIGAASFLIATGFVTCSTRYLAVVFLCLAVSAISFANAGYTANFIDLAPQYAGIIFGISNTLATVPGMISPIVAGALTPNDTSEEWRSVFYIGAAFYAFGAIFYGLFASGEPQSWGRSKLKEKKLEVGMEMVPLQEKTPL